MTVFRTRDPAIYNRLIPRSHRAWQTPEDEAKFDVIFAQKLEEKKVTFAKMGYEVEEEDKKEVRPCRCHPRTITDPCLHVLGLDERRARCVCGSSSTCCGRACVASRQSSSARGRANRPSRASSGWCWSLPLCYIGVYYMRSRFKTSFFGWPGVESMGTLLGTLHAFSTFSP